MKLAKSILLVCSGMMLFGYTGVVQAQVHTYVYMRYTDIAAFNAPGFEGNAESQSKIDCSGNTINYTEWESNNQPENLQLIVSCTTAISTYNGYESNNQYVYVYNWTPSGPHPPEFATCAYGDGPWDATTFVVTAEISCGPWSPN